MAFLRQLVGQYDGSARRQLVSQYFDDSAGATTMVARADNHDSAVGSATITNAATSTPSVSFQRTVLSPFSNWMMILVQFSGCLSKTPAFSADMSEFRGSGGSNFPTSPHEWVWRYRDDSDPGTLFPRDWQTFDNYAESGTTDGLAEFSNNTAFTQDAIEVAVKPRWRYIDTQRAFAYAAASPMASQLPSCDANNVFGTDDVGSEAVENTAPKITLNQYGILLDDASTPPPAGKEKATIPVLLSVHSSEDQGNYAGWRFIEGYLEGVGAQWDALRSRARLAVYDVNPGGRYYGNKRFTTEDGTDGDANRDWDQNPSPSGFVEATKQAMLLDLTRAEFALDFHGDYRLNGNGLNDEYGGFFYPAASSVATEFQTQMDAVAAAGFRDLGDVTGEYGVGWICDNFSGQLGIVAEFPIAMDVYPATSGYDAAALAYTTAFNAMVDNGDLVLADVPGIDITATTAQVAVSTEAATLSMGTAVSASTAQVAVTAYAAGMTQGLSISATTAQVAVNAYAAGMTQGLSISATTAQVAVNAYAAEMTRGLSISATTAQISATTFAASVGVGLQVSATTAQAAVSALAAEVSVGVGIAATAAQIAVTAGTVTLSFDRTIIAQTAQVGVTAYPAQSTASVAIQATTADVAVTAYSAQITTGIDIAATTAQIGITARGAALSTGLTIEAVTAQVAVTTAPASTAIEREIVATTAQVAVSTSPAVLALSTSISAATAQVSMTSHAASVSVVSLLIESVGLHYTIRP